jgi:hypothetical protein
MAKLVAGAAHLVAIDMPRNCPFSKHQGEGIKAWSFCALPI